MSEGPAPTDRNRLGEEASPYLRQHADNPVNWQPWDETALEAAKEADKPIFLSIGYAACHWCHVMEEESFADSDIAERLNDEFIPIKVDREERPDIDAVYMSICQQVTGRGGWPLSAWLTPDGRPFYVGTYFPDEPKRGMPAFPDLLDDIAETWNDLEERPDLLERADQWSAAIENDVHDTPSPGEAAPDESLLALAADTAVRAADDQYGGWGRGQGPKFPQPSRLQILLRAAERRESDEYERVLTRTLDAIAHGGLVDHVGGGFHRYCTDQSWTVPHFEKMLYDNAEITRAFLAGYQFTGNDRYATVIRRALEFVERELTHPDGGFYSTLDAQSETPEGETEEGAFYVWTPDQVHEAIEDETTASLVCDCFGITDAGNFEGSTVLTISSYMDELAESYDFDIAEVRSRVKAGRDRLFEVRGERPRPARDEKILAGWNGLMVSAFAEAETVLDSDFGETAQHALTFLRDRLWDSEEQRLHRRWKDGDVGIAGYLEDYAFLARGALDLFQATRDVDALAFALDLADVIEAEFWDQADETLYFTPTSGDDLVARPQELTDQSTPSSLGVAVETLLSLDHFTDHDRFGSIAGAVLTTHANTVEGNPMEHSSLALAADQHATGSQELTLVADEPPAAWTETLAETHLPSSLRAWRPASDPSFANWLETLGLGEAPPIWADRTLANDEPTVYACQNFTCSPPQHSLEAALDWEPDVA
jgi:uncharacterized protein YyaL (SSP411 family)